MPQIIDIQNLCLAFLPSDIFHLLIIKKLFWQLGTTASHFSQNDDVMAQFFKEQTQS